MRIIAGEFGSRRLKAVEGDHTRPTTDKIKEGIFNMLGGFFTGGCCLDFYGGSGALGIEAVSRGMDHAVITENYRPAQAAIQANIQTTKATDRFSLLKGKNRAALAKYQAQHPDLHFDLVLLDPPYHQEHLVEDIEWLLDRGVIGPKTRIVCESDAQTDLPLTVAGFDQVKDKTYGQTRIRIYQVQRGDEAND